MNFLSALFGPEGFTAALTHHNEPMRFKGVRTSWEGDMEHHTLRYVCDCGFTAEVSTHELIGPPNQRNTNE